MLIRKCCCDASHTLEIEGYHIYDYMYRVFGETLQHLFWNLVYHACVFVTRSLYCMIWTWFKRSMVSLHSLQRAWSWRKCAIWWKRDASILWSTVQYAYITYADNGMNVKYNTLCSEVRCGCVRDVGCWAISTEYSSWLRVSKGSIGLWVEPTTAKEELLVWCHGGNCVFCYLLGLIHELWIGNVGTSEEMRGWEISRDLRDTHCVTRFHLTRLHGILGAAVRQCHLLEID